MAERSRWREGGRRAGRGASPKSPLAPGLARVARCCLRAGLFLAGAASCSVDDREITELLAQASGSACGQESDAVRCSGDFVQRCSALTGEWQNDDAECELGCREGRCRQCDPEAWQSRCSSGQVETCGDDGVVRREACSDGSLCEAGACVDGCEPGRVQCDGESGRARCVDGTTYEPEEPCTGGAGACVDGECVACRPGQVACDGVTPLTCSAQGQWLGAAACSPPAAVCVPSLGACRTCLPGSVRCGPNGQVESCGPSGDAWTTSAVCGGDTPFCVPSLARCGECSPGDERTCVNALGNCASGRQSCGDDARWGRCSTQPAAQDGCQPGDDANCDGTPNNPPGGCACNADVTCGTSDVGICQLGTSTCDNGQLGACLGAIGPAPRDCRSGADNDCDGRPDSTLDGVCQCVPGSVEACNTHPGLDGIGRCRAGERSCVASANALSSAWGACLGSVAPIGRNCSSDLDNDCNGVADRLDDTCLCVPGTTRGCGTAACPGVETCELSADLASTRFGPCQIGPVRFADSALDAAVRLSLSTPTPANQPIDGALVTGLTTLSVRDRGIVRLDGLECASSMVTLDLTDNELGSAAMDVIGQLTSLEYLNLRSNQIADASSLRSLTRLRTLLIPYNQLTDASWLASLPGLLSLDVDGNSIADLSVLASLRSLEFLNVRSNGVRDLSALANLRRLDRLLMGYNPLDDLSVIADLVPMDDLSIGGLPLSDLSILRNQTRLTALWISDTDVTDLSEIPRSLPGLTFLGVSRTDVTDLRPLLQLQSLGELILDGVDLDCSSPALAQLRTRVARISSECD